MWCRAPKISYRLHDQKTRTAREERQGEVRWHDMRGKNFSREEARDANIKYKRIENHCTKNKRFFFLRNASVPRSDPLDR
jgi:hypothetical protein